MVDLRGQRLDQWCRDPHRRQAAQADESELQCQRAEFIAAGGIILLDQPETGKADEIRMGLGRRHASFACEVAQHHRLAGFGKCAQQRAANLDGLNPPALLGHDDACRPAM